jgi:uroporphyrinogen decarboxylase
VWATLSPGLAPEQSVFRPHVDRAVIAQRFLSRALNNARTCESLRQNRHAGGCATRTRKTWQVRPVKSVSGSCARRVRRLRHMLTDLGESLGDEIVPKSTAHIFLLPLLLTIIFKKEMTDINLQIKPLIATLKGARDKRPPIWFMRQAGRYLPEYRETRSQARGFLDLCYRSDLAAEVTLQPLRRYPFDAAIVFADILLIPHALGQKLEFLEGEGPKLDPIRDEAGIAALNATRLLDRLAPVGETLSRLSGALPKDVALIGFAGSPWTVATYMVEGGGSPDQRAAKLWAYRDPKGFGRLIDVIADATIAYLDFQIRAGAEVVQLFDSWAAMIPDPLFEAYVVAPTAKIVKALKAQHPHVPIIGFPRGARNLTGYAEHTGIDALGLDTAVPVDHARTKLQTALPVQGNLDPYLLAAGGPALDREVDRIVEGLSHGPHIFNLGHGIIPETPPENVGRVVNRVKGLA